MTVPTLRVLRTFIADPDLELFGRQICDQTGLPTGTVHPILFRLEQHGWLHAREEQIEPRVEGRARRRYYQLSARGRARAKESIDRTLARRPELRDMLAIDQPPGRLPGQALAQPADQAGLRTDDMTIAGGWDPFEMNGSALQSMQCDRAARSLDGLAGFALDAHGRPPLVRDLTDMSRIGVKPAIWVDYRGTPYPAMSSAGRRAPTYLSRDCDDELRDAVGAGGLVVVHGLPGAGKTRTAWEAVRAWPDRALLVPRRADALTVLARSGLRLTDAIIWIDDLGGVSSCAIDALALSRLCPFASGDLTIVVTARSTEWQRLSMPSSPSTTLASAYTGLAHPRWVVELDQEFTATEMTAANRRPHRDPRIIDALRYGHRRIPAYLGGAEHVWRQWNGERAGDQSGILTLSHTVVRAVLDLHRAGLTTVSRQLVDTLVPDLIPDDNDTVVTPGRLRAAVEWALTAPDGVIPCLTLAALPDSCETQFIPHGELSVRTASTTIPTRVWDLAIMYASTDELLRIGHAAHRHHEPDRALGAYHAATTANNPEAMTILGAYHESAHQIGSAERCYRTAAIRHRYGPAAANMARLRQHQQRPQEALSWWRMAADAGDLNALTNIADVHLAHGQAAEAIRLWTLAAEAGNPSAMRKLGDHLATIGDDDGCARWWRRAAATTGDGTEMAELALIFEDAGQGEQARQWWRRAARADDPTAYWLVSRKSSGGDIHSRRLDTPIEPRPSGPA
ncbi:helix-turn-helix domain-containing protein [Fodinicola acaciae]|uniref:helix-turn-helix domain-containing protein n=1 Tax=Fodinicola acaciae TaxID=2681555 RepID=UPI0013D63076|nr:helix-turn-helix domain-containing protein [Fodinicola acaciae]